MRSSGPSAPTRSSDEDRRRFPDRAALLDPNDARFVTGSGEDRKQARAEWHRQRFIAQVMRSALPEIPRSNLQPLRFGTLEDTTSGELYRARRSDDARSPHPACARNVSGKAE